MAVSTGLPKNRTRTSRGGARTHMGAAFPFRSSQVEDRAGCFELLDMDRG